MSFSSAMPQGRQPMFESLESRQLLSAASTSELVDSTALHTTTADSGVFTLALTKTAATPPTTLAAAPVLPNVHRNYLGDAFNQKNVKLALVIKISKQQDHGTYASLRGDIRLATPTPIQIYFTSITYGKLRSNLHVDFQFSGSNITGTISGKVNTSGSQIKGTFTTTGAYKSTGTFVVKKVVGIG